VAERAWRTSVEEYHPQELIRLKKGAEALIGALADRPPPVEILDVGCGVGPMHEFLPTERFRLTGLERDPDSCETARRHYAHVVCSDLDTAWPFGPDQFDGAIAAAVLEHIVDYNVLLANIHASMKPGGYLVVEVPNLGYWKEVRKLLLRKQPHWLRQMDHVRGWTLRYLSDIVESHGFVADYAECDRLHLPLVPPMRWLERAMASWGNVIILGFRKPANTSGAGPSGGRGR
jgi:SAM-dependent methyltransferase